MILFPPFLGIKNIQPDVQMAEVISLRMRSESSIVKASTYVPFLDYIFFQTFCIFVELLLLDPLMKNIFLGLILKVPQTELLTEDA